MPGKGGRHEYQRTWEPEEDDIATALVLKLGNAWTKIAEELRLAGYGDRSVSSVRNRYGRILQAQKMLADGKALKNRCHLCGHFKRGHTCRGRANGGPQVEIGGRPEVALEEAGASGDAIPPLSPVDVGAPICMPVTPLTTAQPLTLPELPEPSVPLPSAPASPSAELCGPCDVEMEAAHEVEPSPCHALPEPPMPPPLGPAPVSSAADLPEVPGGVVGQSQAGGVEVGECEVGHTDHEAALSVKVKVRGVSPAAVGAARSSPLPELLMPPPLAQAPAATQGGRTDQVDAFLRAAAQAERSAGQQQPPLGTPPPTLRGTRHSKRAEPSVLKERALSQPAAPPPLRANLSFSLFLGERSAPGLSSGCSLSGLSFSTLQGGGDESADLTLPSLASILGIDHVGVEKIGVEIGVENLGVEHSDHLSLLSMPAPAN